MAFASPYEDPEPGPSRSRPTSVAKSSTTDDVASDEDKEKGSKPFVGHTNGIMAITYSPSSKHIATGSQDKTVRVWDAEAGVQIGESMEGHTDEVNTICYSPDGRFLVSGADDGTIRLWNVRENGTHSPAGEPIAAHSSWVMTVKFSPDGKLIASGGRDGMLKLWNPQTHALVHEFKDHKEPIRQVAWSPDGRLVATGSNDNKIRIFDVAIRKLAMEPIGGHREWVRSVAFSPDGKVLASASDDHSVRLWDVKTGKPAKNSFRGHTYWVGSIEWSPDGKRLLSGSHDKTVRVWDIQKAKPVFKTPLYGHMNDIRALTYSPNGKFFASADMGSSPRIQIWNAETGKAHFPSITDKERTAFEQEAKKPRNDDGEVRKPGKMRAGSSILAVAWLPSGRRFASVGEDFVVRIWNADTGTQVGEIASHEEIVNDLSISSDGELLATASDDRTIRVFIIETGKPFMEPLKDHTESVYAVTFTPDNSRLVSGGMDTTIRFWSARTGEHQYTIEKHTTSIRSLAVSPDGTKLASGANDNRIYVWDMHSYDLLAGPFVHDDWVRCVRFSPDCTRLVSGSDDNRVRVWNISSGQLAFPPIERHTHWVGAVDWAPDGRRILSAGYDTRIYIWDADTGKRAHGPLKRRKKKIRAAAFSPDGARFLTGSLGHTLYIWDANTGKILLEEEKTDSSKADSESESDAEANSESENDESNAQRRGAGLAKQRAVGRQDSLDSFLNRPAIPRAALVKQRAGANSFWDDADDGLAGPSRRIGGSAKQKETSGGDNKNTVDNETRHRTLVRFLKRISIHGGSTRGAHAKGKARDSSERSKQNERVQSTQDTQEASDTESQQHRVDVQKPESFAMRKFRLRPRPVEVSSGRAKLRVAAAGDLPRQTWRRNQEESSDSSDSDEEGNQGGGDSPIESEAHRGDDSDSLRRKYGLLETICFCLCLPCCK